MFWLATLIAFGILVFAQLNSWKLESLYEQGRLKYPSTPLLVFLAIAFLDITGLAIVFQYIN